MGTVLECQGERNFQNLEQCHEIQGEITTKIVYPINHPCFIGGISLKTNRNFETEEKMVQFDSNNILETYQNSNNKSNKNFNFDKNKIKDNINNALKNNKENNNKVFEDEEMEINALIEDDNNENDKVEKEKNVKDKNDNILLKQKNLNENYILNNLNNKDILKNNNFSNSDDNLKIIEKEIDLFCNQIIGKRNEKIENNKYDFQKIFDKNKIKPNDNNFFMTKNKNGKLEQNKINKNLILKNKKYNQSPDAKYNYLNNEYNMCNKKESLKNINENKLKNNVKKVINNIRQNNNIKKDKLINNRLVNKYNNNSNYNNLLKKINKLDNNNNSKRSSCSNKNYMNNKNNKFINNSINKNKKIINSNKIKTIIKKDLNLKNISNEQNLYKSSINKKYINKLNENNQHHRMKKNFSYQNLKSYPLTDSINNNKTNNSKKINAFYEENIYKRKIKNNIPVYRRLSPEERDKKSTNRRLSYLTNSNKKIYKSSSSESGARNYNFRDDLWDYFNRDPLLNTSKNKTVKNIINITKHIPHSRSENNFNHLILNNYDCYNNYYNEDSYNINHQYNKSMNYNGDSFINKIYKTKQNKKDNDEKLLYNLKNQNYLINFDKNNKNENDIKDFIKVRIPFNGTQICPILINYSTNNLFILNYNNLNKFSEKSILYDGNIFKVVNTQNGNTQLISRYFQITKNCFRYYNNIYSVLIYNENPLVQFDIRHIEDIQNINLSIPKIEYSFSINLINNSDFFIFATDDKEFGNNIVNVLNLLRNYYKEEKDLFEQRFFN